MAAEFIISWNCNGLKPHMAELLNYLQNSNPQPFLICLQECNLHTNILPNIPAYSLINSTRINNSGGGTAIYIKSNIPYTQVYFIPNLNSEIEYTSLKIDYNDSNLTITSMYIRPQAQIKLQDLIEMELDKKHLILGDLNGKHSLWGSHKNDNRGNTLYNFFESKNLICLNNGEGTRIGNWGQLSHLDIVLSSANISTSAIFEILEDS